MNEKPLLKMIDDNSSYVKRKKEESSMGIETRPLMQLFQCLIDNTGTEQTMLTDTQIKCILHEEFNIEITTLHELEIDIYLNIVKKFLKAWPQWSEFNRGLNWMKRRIEFPSQFKRTLERKYKNLKEYLSVRLEITKPLAKEAVKKIRTENLKKMEEIDTSDVVLEIDCTRRQLNELIFAQPNPECENCIFNLQEYKPTTTSLKNLPMEAILNWWGVEVTIVLKTILFHRSTKHQLKHTLVNKNNGPRNLKQILNQNLQRKDLNCPMSDIKKAEIYALLDTILKNSLANSSVFSMLQSLFNVIKSDLEMIASNTIPVPASFWQYSNKYPYYRRLSKKPKDIPVSSSENVYDLYIEETLAPMHLIHIEKINYESCVMNLPPNVTWLEAECSECKCKFEGVEVCTVMKEHFIMYHAHEPFWTCTNCEKTFSMLYLAEHKWLHDCNVNQK